MATKIRTRRPAQSALNVLNELLKVYTPKEISYKSGVALSTISKIRKGVLTYVNVPTLLRLTALALVLRSQGTTDRPSKNLEDNTTKHIGELKQGIKRSEDRDKLYTVMITVVFLILIILTFAMFIMAQKIMILS